jgi:hypothetical protein
MTERNTPTIELTDDELEGAQGGLLMPPFHLPTLKPANKSFWEVITDPMNWIA